MTRLDDILTMLVSFDGISRKFVLPSIIDKLRLSSFKGDTPHGLGEDSAAIDTNSDELVLLTTDAIVEDLCLQHPSAAGFNAVLANVMDIYAAGGTPTSFAVALSYSDSEIGEGILDGLIKGSHTFKIPIVRGHTNPNSTSTYVVGSATGTVQKNNILTAGGAESDNILVVLFDRTGQRGAHYKLGWDSVTDRSSENVVKRLSVMNDIAEGDLVTASKDVSVAGIAGTAAMMLEYSGMGGTINLDLINRARPQNIILEDWLRMYISLGFLVATTEEKLPELKRVAKEHELSACRIGSVDDTREVKLTMSGVSKVMFDFTKGPVLTPRTGHD
ncbi:MAG: AIR synthase related protein [Candidatus Thorarchaeota archaeon]